MSDSSSARFCSILVAASGSRPIGVGLVNPDSFVTSTFFPASIMEIVSSEVTATCPSSTITSVAPSSSTIIRMFVPLIPMVATGVLN